MINLELPLNNLSFGHCSYNILRELHSRGEDICLFPTGNTVDFSPYVMDSNFGEYLNRAMTLNKTDYDRNDKTFKLWHLDGSEHSVGKEQTLFTFHEVDQLTVAEINRIKNCKKVLVSSKYTLELAQKNGLTNVEYCPLGFDGLNFSKTGRKYHADDIVTFSLFGKFEKRKHTEKVIRAWLKKYGKNRRFILNLHVYNPFFNPEQNNQILLNIFGGVKPFNVNTLPYTKTLRELNEGLNACNIVIDMSGGEGFSIPSFSALCLGKHGVLHNCSSIHDWAGDSGAVLVEPSGKEPVYDGVFFNEGRPFGQGNIFNWDEEEFLNACETAIGKHLAGPNTSAPALRQKYSWSKAVDIIIKTINE